MQNSPGGNITYEQDKKNMGKLQLRMNGASAIIFRNYKSCLEVNGIQYYYELYIQRCNKKSKESTTFENYERDLDMLMEKYCDYLSSKEETIDDMKARNAIYFAYQDLIDDSTNMGDDKLVGLEKQ